MSDLTKEQIEQIAHLCRLSLSEEEKGSIRNSIDAFLEYTELLDEIPTDGVEPCVSVLHNMECPLREDAEGEPFSKEEFWENTPDKVGSMVKVPTVIQFNGES